MKFSVVCPVCRETLVFEQKGEVSYGVINLEDLACAEVTMSWDAKVAAHLDAHRMDGSHMAKIEEQWKYQQERAERFFARKAEEKV